MKTRPLDSIPVHLAPRAMPEAKALLGDLDRSIQSAAWFQDGMVTADNARRCWWQGQTPDGKVHGTTKNPAAPWENAAAHRVHLLLSIMNERTSVRRRALKSAKISIEGRGIEDRAGAARLKQVLEYYLKTAMRDEVDTESTHWSNWCQSYGHAVMFCGWKQERQLEERKVTLMELQQAHASIRLAESAPQMMEAGVAMTPEAEQALQEAAFTEVLEHLESDNLLPLMATLLILDEDLVKMGRSGKSESMRILRQLQSKPEAQYFAPRIKESRPYWEALQPYVDVFYPPETRKLCDAPWIARTRWLTEVQLMAFAEEEGMDQDWLREVLKNPGKCLNVAGLADWVMSASGTRRAANVTWSGASLKYFQIVEVYWKAMTPYGVPVIYRTIAHGKVTGSFGKHEVCKEYHGNYPFHALLEERWDRYLLDSRGVPEIASTYQDAIAAQWNSRTNAASISTLPPLIGPPGSAPPKLGPGVYIDSPRAGMMAWMQPPQQDSRSIEIEQTILAATDRLYGRISKNVPEPLTILVQQTLADEMLASATQLITMTLQLIQQFMPTIVGRRITGTDDYVSATRDEIQCMYDIRVEWDVRDLSLDWIEQKLKFYTSMLLPIDNRGIIDRGAMIRIAAESVDPAMAHRLVREDGAVDRIENDEEAAALSSIFSGGLPTFVVGVNHELRAQVMQDDLKASPVRQATMRANPMVAKVWEERLQKHLFQLEQEKNKQVGIEGGSDPLSQSPLAMLKATGWQGMISPQTTAQSAS